MPVEVSVPLCLKPSLTVLGFSKGPITLVSKYKQGAPLSNNLNNFKANFPVSSVQNEHSSTEPTGFKTYEAFTVQKDCCLLHTKGAQLMYQWPLSK